jgi:drug/metabolite transporter (DMT)-like permease
MTHHWGYVGALTAALLFGASTVLNKVVLVEVHPLLVAGAIYLTAGIVLSMIRISPLYGRILSLLETPTSTETSIGLKDYVVLSFVVLFGSVIAPYLYMYGLNETTAINASFLSNSEPLFTALLALTVLKERGEINEYLGFLIVALGAIFLTTNGEFHKLTLSGEIFGNLLIVTACFSWGIDNNLSRVLSIKKDIILITALKCLSGGIILLLLSFPLKVDVQIPLTALPYLFSVGAFSIGFSVLFFLFALREIGAMKTGAIFSTASLFGALTAFLVLKETFTPIQLTAGITMLIGVLLMYRK